MELIKSRVNDAQVWPPIIIFPEGTTTNQEALISFKAGAFVPGVPVQPMTIKYPDEWVGI